jgi:RimJ/RimL family protein N-acetyltransferase
MKDNYESIICRQEIGIREKKKVLLVPYRPEHVDRYHAWMQRPDLLAATASEPLTLPEEYEMQESWYRDSNKCTCIILSVPRLCDIFPKLVRILEEEQSDDLWNEWMSQHPDWICQSIDAMVGDVNLFLSDLENDNDDHNDSSSSIYKQAEVDIMIAEPWARQQGCATEAVFCILIYGAERLGIARYYCKIHETNTASRALFAEKLHFRQVQYTECFQEYEYECVAETPSEMMQLVQALLRSTNESASPTLIRVLPCPLPPSSSDTTTSES